MSKRNRVSYAQQALPFAGAGTRLVQEPLRREWRAITVAGCAVILVLLTYGYCVVSSIAEVSLREFALKESRTLMAERATLEGTLFETSHGITLTYAHALGYRDSTNKVFVTREHVVSYAEADAR